MQQLVHHRALAAAAHAGHTHQPAQRKLHIEASKVVALAAHQGDLAGSGVAPFRRGGDRTATAQVGTGERVFRADEGVEIAFSHDVAAVHASSRTDIHDVIGGADRVFVVLHHDQGVAQIAQLDQRVEQAVVITLVQADARLIEHVEHAGETSADLGGQTDALGFTARECHRRAIKTEVVEPHIEQKLEPHADLAQHQITDLDLASIQQWLIPFVSTNAHQLFDAPQAFTHAAAGELMDAIRPHPHRQSFRFEAQAMTTGAGHQL